MAFAIKYRLEFKDVTGTNWKVDILEDGYVGSITSVTGYGQNPLLLKLRVNDVKMKHSPIASSSIELVLVAETDYDLIEFSYGSSKQYLTKVYYGTAQVFEGYILKGVGSQDYRQAPYPIKLVATDFISSLKEIPYVRIIASNDIVLCSDVLMQITNVGIGISKVFLDSSALFNNQDSPGANDVSMNLTFVNQRVFTTKEMSYYDVLEELMKTHYCRFHQHNGTGSSDCFWMVDNLELHKDATDITYKKRNATTYAYVSDLVVSQPTLLHTDVTPLATGTLSFVEAAHNINVDSELVEPFNILTETGINSFPGSSILKWTEIGQGKMGSSTDANGYASLNSYNFFSFRGVKHLGIGPGAVGSLYTSSVSGKTHDITIVTDIGSGIYELTFTNEFVSPPTWTTTAGEKLYIEDRGLFEITTNAAGGSGTSTIRIRVNKNSMIPRVGDRIIGDVDDCKVLEQTVSFEFLFSDREFVRDENVVIELELTYANRWYDISVLGESRDEAINFIGIKAGDASGDTFSGEVWGNLAVNTTTNSFSQIVQFPETKHEQFETYKIEIPLDWDVSLSNSQFLTIALINGYAKGLLYKSINLKIKGAENFTYNLINDADNDTDIDVVSPLFKVAENTENSEYASIGGIITSLGNEVTLFGTTNPKVKNVYIADQIKLEYGDNAQVWRGRIRSILFGNEIIQDPENSSRNFQIQESVISANRATTSITAVEIRPSGEDATINLISMDKDNLFFDPHLAASTSTEDVIITNEGNNSITVTGSSGGAHFTISANQVVPAYASRTFTITSTADLVDNYTETISFVDTLAAGNTVTVKCSNSVITEVTPSFNFKLLTHFPIVLTERYDFEDPQTHSTLVSVENTDTADVVMEPAGTPSLFNFTPPTRTIRASGSESFDLFYDGGDEEGVFNGSYQFFDSGTDNFLDVDASINVITGLRMFQTPQVSGIIENRVRLDGGAWIDLTVGLNEYVNYVEANEIEWYLEVSGTLEDIKMSVHEHSNQAVLTSFTGTAIDTSHTLTFTPFALIGGPNSSDISITDVS